MGIMDIAEDDSESDQDPVNPSEPGLHEPEACIPDQISLKDSMASRKKGSGNT